MAMLRQHSHLLLGVSVVRSRRVFRKDDKSEQYAVVEPCFKDRGGECSIDGSIIRIAMSQRKAMTETNVEKTSKKGNEQKCTGQERCTYN